jgi:ankyrin repeat protein
MFSQRNRELGAAIYVGDLAGVIKCLDKGPKRERADPNQADSAGRLPLTRAAGNDYKYYTDYTACRICSALLDRGAEVDKRWNWWEPTALYLACSKNRVQTAELLIERGANIEFVYRENGYAPLHVACAVGSINVVQLLLDHGADIKRVSRNGHKPLHVASCTGKVEVVALIFDRDLVDFYLSSVVEGQTALSLACREGHMDVVRCLLARGVATYRSHGFAQDKPAIKALLDAAAPPNKRRLAHWINRIDLHVVGPRGDHQGSARHRLLNCRHLTRHLVSFLLVRAWAW